MLVSNHPHTAGVSVRIVLKVSIAAEDSRRFSCSPGVGSGGSEASLCVPVGTRVEKVIAYADWSIEKKYNVAGHATVILVGLIGFLTPASYSHCWNYGPRQ